MYKLLKDIILNKVTCVQRLSDNAYIPFQPFNSDYTRFKEEILAETAQLQDADGNTMTAAEAKSYIATLP